VPPKSPLMLLTRHIISHSLTLPCAPANQATRSTEDTWPGAAGKAAAVMRACLRCHTALVHVGGGKRGTLPRAQHDASAR
jgi:hypothetical protein